MRSIFQSNQFTEKKIVKNYDDGDHNGNLIEEDVHYESSSININIKKIMLDGVHIFIRNEELSPPFVMDVEHDFPFMKMHFEMEGSSKYTPKNAKSLAVDIPSGHYNFFFLPKVKGTLTYDSPKRKTLEINFNKRFLKRVFGDSLMEASSAYGKALKNNTPFLMWDKSKPIPSNLLIIIQEIINCNFEGCIKKIYLESKVIEMLTILLNDIKTKKSTEKEIVEIDYLKIIKAESILRENLKNPPTIPELSILIGLNQYKLKQYFKQVYRRPIFSYTTSLRMEKAIQLIVEQGNTVSEAAYEIGYKNPQHFTDAFKRKYNFLPSSLKAH
ncbi:helix-turn-helix domain-containing protein [Polaribacter sargassicola]|uniref:helix-turn-helix domain-containing protein n=1 Tax=Polaribacter sargassicola TaxID=2836891 RepID=UPI001F3D6F01|nr:AraC family transcriptional regulator [Polaribacter sp. DS7-9]MCG1035317.1 AraC family transcriptional regulator [Polaribacter sp. DS7-9]